MEKISNQSKVGKTNSKSSTNNSKNKQKTVSTDKVDLKVLNKNQEISKDGDVYTSHLDPSSDQNHLKNYLRSKARKIIPETTRLDLLEIYKKGYKIKKEIYTGTFAHICVAKSRLTKLEVVLKIHEMEKISLNHKEKFLSNEVKVIRQLQHINIIKFYEAFNTTKYYVMVMEFAENGTFADLLNQLGFVSETLGKKLFFEIATGLDYMHNKWIAHRDLKLENLLLTKEMKPRICDFSYSLVWNHQILCVDFCGTPVYFSPEIYQKKAHNPLANDMWSFGVCLFIMLNNRIPFDCPNDEAIVKKQLARDWDIRKPYWDKTSNELKILMDQLLDPNPNTRITALKLIQCYWFEKSQKLIDNIRIEIKS